MKFRTKTVLGVTLIQAVLLSVLVVSVLSRMSEACRQQIEYRAQVTGQLLAAAARDPMVAYDVSTLKSLATDLVASGQVAYVSFLDENGVSMVASGPGLTQSGPAPQTSDDTLMARAVTIEVAGKTYGSVHFGIQLDEMTARLAAVRQQTIVIALGVMAAVATFSLLLGSLLTRRLNELNAASREIAGGNLGHQVNVQGTDDLADTARNFNRMAKQLAAVKQAHESALSELRQLAYHDPLTGAHNRRSFHSALEQEHRRVQRTHTPAALLALDIDHFKSVNDTWGHDAGDDVIKHLVTVLQHSLRNIDILGRVGGEEFAILLPETTLEGARETAERLRVAVQDNPAVRVSPDGQAPLAAIPFTISLGVAAFDPEQTHTDELLKRADVAMYQAKAAGRNKVCVSALSAKPMEQAS